MFFGLTGDRHDDRATTTHDGTERGLVHGDTRGEFAAAQFAIEVFEQQNVIDDLVISAGTGAQQSARMAGKVLRDAGLIAFTGETLRGADQRLELRRLGTQLAEQPDTADRLGSFVRKQGEEGDVLLGKSIESIGVAVHHADDVAHELHGNGEFRADTLTELDVARILRDIRDALRPGVEGDPTGDTLPLVDDLVD